MKNLKDFTVLGSNGSIDHAASAAKFAEALLVYEAASKVDLDGVKEAVNAVLDENRGKAIPKFKQFVMTRLDVSPDNYSFVAEALDSVVASMTGEYGEGEIFTGKGLGGGTWRWADASEKQIEASLKRIKERK